MVVRLVIGSFQVMGAASSSSSQPKFKAQSFKIALLVFEFRNEGSCRIDEPYFSGNR